MTARNDQPGGPWWRPAATENAAAFMPDVCASSSTMHYMKGSVRGAHQAAGVLLGTHYAIHFPGSVEDEDDNDRGNNENNKTSSSSSNHNGTNSGDCHMPLTMAPPAWEEAMFEKPLTPSDVGKLNRLVIPKQYAERYFPIDPASEEKGLQLSFEDEAGKVWRFRYSYWNSSQSYVLTKGWSRYVKDKRLDAGDVVSFHRGDRLYIRCRRSSADGGSPAPATAGWGQLVYQTTAGPPAFYPRAGDGTGTVGSGSPVAGSKRVVRLFGVNLDCPAGEVSQPAWTDGL